MGLGADRNKPCWCGSGKKFKKCHLGREDLPRPSHGEVIHTASRIHGRKVCLYPNAGSTACQGGIVKAHSVQRALLEKIARKGHVIRWNHHLASLLKHSGQLRADKIGLNEASTFTGFCGLHDNAVFASIEKSPIRPSNEHAALLAYRALAREVFAKLNQRELSLYQKTLDRGTSLPDQIALQSFMATYEPGVELGLRDLQHHKTLYDAVVLSGDTNSVRSYWFTLDRQPDFACTGCIFPEMDFQGRPLQDLSDASAIMGLVSVSVLPGAGHGYVALSWLEPSVAPRKLVESLLNLPDDQIPHAITRFAFEFYENIFISPDWWDGLAETDRQLLLARVHTATSSSQPRLLTCLADDGQRIAQWSIAQSHDFR